MLRCLCRCMAEARRVLAFNMATLVGILNGIGLANCRIKVVAVFIVLVRISEQHFSLLFL